MNAVTRHVERICVSKGLEELGDNYDLLTGLWEILQFVSLEAADPGVDPLKFADNVCDFSLIIKKVHEEEFKIKSATAPGEKPRETRTSSDLRFCQMIGFIYLAYSDTPFQPYKTSELKMGIVLRPEHRCKD
ncbi:hypothetical protein APHAL10511_002861 [Amanita phalloides]|nr:hypothetical protein APHAL10511_002861 [Amanita phalloides]